MSLRTCVGLASFIVLGACSATEPGRAPELLTALPRELTADEQRVSHASNAFTLALFRGLNQAQPDSNVFVSPLSVSFALGMAMNGAEDQTFDEMRQSLGFAGATLDEINRGYAGLMALESGLDPTTTFTIANSVWIRQGFPVKQPFIDQVRATFDAQVRSSPFDAATITAVNGWVSEQTKGRIPTILDEIRDEDVMFLINAIYFKGHWREAFDPDATSPGGFMGGDGRERSAMLLRQEGTLRYRETERYQAVDLPYGNGAFAMTVILPRPDGTPADLLAGLDPASWRDLVAGLREETVHLTLPRFRLDYARSLGPDLAALGMGMAFEAGRADFSRIADMDGLFLTRVEQKTFVEVNEEGTEAAAATAVGVGVTSAPLTFAMVVDRPFFFAIRERFSGALLFVGVMNAIGE